MRQRRILVPAALVLLASGAGAGVVRSEATADLPRAMLGQIRPCWTPDPDDNGPAVVLAIHLNKDGSLAGKPQLAAGASAPSPSAAAAAISAVEHCAPYKLPPASYNSWKDQELTFDTKFMKP